MTCSNNVMHYSSKSPPICDIILFSTPLVNCARIIAAPPLINVRIPQYWFVTWMKKWTQSTPEFCVNKMATIFPSEVIFVERLIFVKYMKIAGQFFRRWEIFNVNEGMRRRNSQVIFFPGSHYNRYHVIPEK